MRFADHDGSGGVEGRLHAMRGDAYRAPDLSGSILSRMAESRPFADQRTLRIRRWGRIVGTAVAAGLAVCAALVLAQWPLIAPGLSPERPVQGVVASAVADVQAGNKTIRQVPARLTLLARGAQARTDPADSQVVRSLATNVIVPLGAAMQVAPTLEPTEAEENLAARLLESGQRMLSTAEKFASAFKSGAGSETFADRLGRAVGGAPAIDGGPQ